MVGVAPVAADAWASFHRYCMPATKGFNQKGIGRYVDEFVGRHNKRPSDTNDQMGALVSGIEEKRLVYQGPTEAGYYLLSIDFPIATPATKVNAGPRICNASEIQGRSHSVPNRNKTHSKTSRRTDRRRDAACPLSSVPYLKKPKSIIKTWLGAPPSKKASFPVTPSALVGASASSWISCHLSGSGADSSFKGCPYNVARNWGFFC